MVFNVSLVVSYPLSSRPGSKALWALPRPPALPVWLQHLQEEVRGTLQVHHITLLAGHFSAPVLLRTTHSMTRAPQAPRLSVVVLPPPPLPEKNLEAPASEKGLCLGQLERQKFIRAKADEHRSCRTFKALNHFSLADLGLAVEVPHLRNRRIGQHSIGRRLRKIRTGVPDFKKTLSNENDAWSRHQPHSQPPSDSINTLLEYLGDTRPAWSLAIFIIFCL